MGRDDKTSGVAGLVVLVLVATGAFYAGWGPLNSRRPAAAEPQTKLRAVGAEVDARLWQDPLEAVHRARERERRLARAERRDAPEAGGAAVRAQGARVGGATGAGGPAGAQRAAPASPALEGPLAIPERLYATLWPAEDEAMPVGVAEPKRRVPLVLAVMLPGGPNAEQAERRRRTRHAVLAALDAHGFVPSDGEHLGYFDMASSADAARMTVVYERFEVSIGMRERPETCQRCRGVVFWLDASDFTDRPLARLADIAKRLRPAVGKPAGAEAAVEWRVIGPPGSKGLRTMVLEAARPDGRVGKEWQRLPLRLYSPEATVPDSVLLAEVKQLALARAAVATKPAAAASARAVAAAASAAPTTSDFLAGRGVTMLRTTAGDGVLARALVQELERRGLKATDEPPPPGRCPGSFSASANAASSADGPAAAAAPPLPSTIAIVSEMDSVYGRSLRRQFRPDVHRSQRGFCVMRWHYLRGLDGRAPGDAAPAVEAPAHDAAAPKEPVPEPEEWVRHAERRPIERAEGQSQFDHLRRLAAQLRAEDERLRRLHGREHGIRAIGVLGSDVHDKLLVLKALQSEMPHALYFTTDLDARLTHPHEHAWAHNLIVASSFGLRLADPLQEGYAPWRDSVQTSTFLATLLALNDVAHRVDHHGGGPDAHPEPEQRQLNSWWLSQPRIFEISRTGAFDFSRPHAGELTPGTASPCERRKLTECKEIHPPGSARFAPLVLAARYLVALVVVAGLVAPLWALNRALRRRINRWVVPGSGVPAWKLAGATALGLGFFGFLVPLGLAWAWPHVLEELTRSDKPWVWNEGISPWPTYALQALTLVLCMYFAASAWVKLQANLQALTARLRLGPARRRLHALRALAEKELSRGARLWAMLAVRFRASKDEREGACKYAELPAPAYDFWAQYLVQDRPLARLVRTALAVAVVLAVGALVGAAFGEPPVVPQRGFITANIQPWSTYAAVLAILALVFFVADATLLSVHFIRDLRRTGRNWPRRTLRLFRTNCGVPAPYLDEWIDLLFVAERTRCIAGLVYYPFIVLSLMLLARSSFFDDWTLPPSLLATVTMSLIVVVSCVVALRREAEASRRQALQRLDDAWLRAQANGDEQLAAQLAAMRVRVEALRDGALAPFSQQPLVKAVLVPLATAGGTAILEALTLAAR